MKLLLPGFGPAAEVYLHGASRRVRPLFGTRPKNHVHPARFSDRMQTATAGDTMAALPGSLNILIFCT